MTTPEIRSEYPLSNEAFAALGAPQLVYVRGMTAAAALAGQPQALAAAELTPEQTVYVVHRADGVRLAIVTDREQAYAAALAHDLAPVSVH
jgi:hypothetical protein